MDEDTSKEPTFRAKKRQKVYRKRADSDDADEATVNTAAQVDAITNHAQSVDDQDTAPVRVLRKPGVKKQGIAFSSSEGRRDAERDVEAEKALVLAQVEAAGQDAPGADRFVRPTGRVAVTEDRHMMAYIDAKLAEARSVTPADVDADDQDLRTALAAMEEDEAQSIKAQDQAASSSHGHGVDTRLSQAAQQVRSSQRNPRRPKRSRRPERGADDIARDSMIDQIMHEGQVPLYSEPVAGSRSTAPNDVEGDNDEAAAEAFKAQLLAEMQMQNRRRPAPKAAAAGGKDAKVSTGPKLGGSRSQREKMKAIEEAKVGKK